MSLVMDILRLPFEVLAALFNLMWIGFTSWWGWLIWAAIVACIVVVLRRDLRFALEGLWAAGSNAARLVRRKDRS
jgi:hypothetical protein